MRRDARSHAAQPDRCSVRRDRCFDPQSSDRCCDTDAPASSTADPDAHPNPQSDTDSHANAHSHTNHDRDAHPDSHRTTNPNPNTNPDSHTDTDTDPSADSGRQCAGPARGVPDDDQSVFRRLCSNAAP